MKTLQGLGWLAAFAFAALPAQGDVSLTDLQVAARALTFMENPPSGRVRVGIVYSPRSPRSQAQAEALRVQLGQGMIVGNIDLRPVLVAIDRAATAEVDLFLLTEHMPPTEGGLAAVSRTRQIPCVTTDVEQVEKGACVVAVRSQPKVQIIVNRNAANDSGVRFATAFRVMVTEL
jgi:ABC-type uncharacterized transport system substrate-binding protein